MRVMSLFLLGILGFGLNFDFAKADGAYAPSQECWCCFRPEYFAPDCSFRRRDEKDHKNWVNACVGKDGKGQAHPVTDHSLCQKERIVTPKANAASQSTGTRKDLHEPLITGEAPPKINSGSADE